MFMRRKISNFVQTNQKSSSTALINTKIWNVSEPQELATVAECYTFLTSFYTLRYWPKFSSWAELLFHHNNYYVSFRRKSRSAHSTELMNLRRISRQIFEITYLFVFVYFCIIQIKIPNPTKVCDIFCVLRIHVSPYYLLQYNVTQIRNKLGEILHCLIINYFVCPTFYRSLFSYVYILSVCFVQQSMLLVVWI